MRDERPTVARIDLGAAAANVREAVRHAAGSELIAVVKADAYGHGAVPLARAFLAAGSERLAAVTVGEAAQLREAGIDAPMLLLGGLHGAAEARACLDLGLIPALQDPTQLALLAAAVRDRAAGPVPVEVEVEVDTGMARMGVPVDRVPAFLARLAEHSELRLHGLYTHLARADESDLTPSREQLARFEAVLGPLRAGSLPPSLHVANSAGLLAGAALGSALPAGLTAVRPGLMLYGVSPAPHLEAALQPVMALVSRVAALRDVQAGTPVGYGATWRAPAAGAVATLPVGYADGVPWAAANRAEVGHRGRRLPLVGRVSMDYVTVFCADGDIALGDEVVLFGGEGPSVEAWAAAAGTIPYELLVRVGARVPRVYIASD